MAVHRPEVFLPVWFNPGTILFEFLGCPWWVFKWIWRHFTFSGDNGPMKNACWIF